jgi:hypothetical protein
MEARMNVFEERLDKMDVVGKACIGKTKAYVETGQEPMEAESKTGFEEMDTRIWRPIEKSRGFIRKFLTKRTQWGLSELWWTELWPRNRP